MSATDYNAKAGSTVTRRQACARITRVMVADPRGLATEGLWRRVNECEYAPVLVEYLDKLDVEDQRCAWRDFATDVFVSVCAIRWDDQATLAAFLYARQA